MKVKKIIAAAVAVATAATMVVSAGALTFNRKANVGSDGNISATDIGVYRNDYTTLSSVLQRNNSSYYLDKTTELTRDFLNDQRTKNNGYVYLTYNFNKSYHSQLYYNELIAVLYEGCTVTDAYMYTEGMVIMDNFGRRIIPELRYDKESNRYFIVCVGTFETEFKGSMAELMKYLLNNKYITIRLASGDKTNKVYTGVWTDDKYVSASDIKTNSTSYTYRTSLNEGTEYRYYVEMNRRICGMGVNNDLRITKGNKTTVHHSLRATNRYTTTREAGATYDVYTCNSEAYKIDGNKDYDQELLLLFNNGKYTKYNSKLAYRINYEVGSCPKLINKTIYSTCYGDVNSLDELDYGYVTWTTKTYDSKTKTYITRTYSGTKKDYVEAKGLYKKMEVKNSLITLTIGRAYTTTDKYSRTAGMYISSTFAGRGSFVDLRNELANKVDEYAITVYDADGFVGSLTFDWNHNTKY